MFPFFSQIRDLYNSQYIRNYSRQYNREGIYILGPEEGGGGQCFGYYDP